MLEIEKTAYHLVGNGQIENIHTNIRNILNATVKYEPQNWYEQLD